MTDARERVLALKQTFYPESRFGGFSDIDGTMLFFNRVNALISHESVLVNYGCGRGAYGEDFIQLARDLRIFKGRVARVIGLDIDIAAEQNPYLDEFHLLKDYTWPTADASVDICVCDNVIEHIEHPEAFLAECRRSIKPGGYLCLRTPNLLSYVGLIGQMVPGSRRRKLLGAAAPAVEKRDIFPVYMRCNTKWKLRRALRRHGFETVVYGHSPEPNYLGFSKITYSLGVAYNKLMPNAFSLALFAFARRRLDR